jgi:hypothetical protein
MFDVKRMKKLAKKDKFIGFAVKNEGNSDKDLEIIYNTYVIGDIVLEEVYKEC